MICGYNYTQDLLFLHTCMWDVCVNLSWCERISSLALLSLADRVTETSLIQH